MGAERHRRGVWWWIVTGPAAQSGKYTGYEGDGPDHGDSGHFWTSCMHVDFSTQIRLCWNSDRLLPQKVPKQIDRFWQKNRTNMCASDHLFPCPTSWWRRPSIARHGWWSFQTREEGRGRGQAEHQTPSSFVISVKAERKTGIVIKKGNEER